ncbi:MAG: hypothetical protein H0T59_07110 [Chloroflexi bacterium]|nr:hypothetical protein [Chloroflexota bacterium]
MRRERQVDPPLDAATMRRLLLHEARVHASPARDLRDLGDAILLHDPIEREPFWNRVEAVRWPVEPAAFDRRLTEILVLFAALGRTPHVWASPLHDTPSDLVDRLGANGFRDMGAGGFMVLGDREAVDRAARRPLPPDTIVERLSGLSGGATGAAASAIVDVLVDAFDVDAARRPAIEGETRMALADPWFTYYLVRADGVPAAVARRATFDGASYLSSIGTARWARGRGFGQFLTAQASLDGTIDPDAIAYLGVFANNLAAIRAYERVGYRAVGSPAPDLLLL